MKMKTARFGTVIAKCGKPVPHLAWVDVEKDRELKSALGANRVMTIHQIARGGHKDFGTVGLSKGPHTQILLFPKSLRRFNDRRIVAIDYDLVLGAAKFQPATDAPIPHTRPARARHRPAEIVAFPRDAIRSGAARPVGTAPTKPIKLQPLLEAQTLVTWSEALAEIEKIKRRMKSRRASETATALAELAQRIRERLKPH